MSHNCRVRFWNDQANTLIHTMDLRFQQDLDNGDGGTGWATRLDHQSGWDELVLLLGELERALSVRNTSAAPYVGGSLSVQNVISNTDDMRAALDADRVGGGLGRHDPDALHWFTATGDAPKPDVTFLRDQVYGRVKNALDSQ